MIFLLTKNCSKSRKEHQSSALDCVSMFHYAIFLRTMLKILMLLLTRKSTLTHFSPMFYFQPPENVIKPLLALAKLFRPIST